MAAADANADRGGDSFAHQLAEDLATAAVQVADLPADPVTAGAPGEAGGGDHLATLRDAGWSVAVHNDYRLHGEPHTFWLLTHPTGRWVKGEGLTDDDALFEARVSASLLKDEADARALAAPAGAGVAPWTEDHDRVFVRLSQDAFEAYRSDYVFSPDDGSDHELTEWEGVLAEDFVQGYLVSLHEVLRNGLPLAAAQAPAAAVEVRTVDLHHDPERAYTLAELDRVVRAMEPGASAPAAAGETGDVGLPGYDFVGQVIRDVIAHRGLPNAGAIDWTRRRADVAAIVEAVDRVRDASPGAGTDGAVADALKVIGSLLISDADRATLLAALRPDRPAAPADGASVPAELRRLSEFMDDISRNEFADAAETWVRARIDAEDRAAARAAERGEG